MVRAVLAAADARDAAGAPIPIRLVRATAGKRARAEPVAALYEQGRVAHAGAFAELEEQLMALGTEDDGEGGEFDRVDALVWAVTALLLDRWLEPRMRVLDWGLRPSGLSAV